MSDDPTRQPRDWPNLRVNGERMVPLCCQECGEFTNPYRTEGSPPGRVDLPIRADAWDEGHAAGEAAATARIVKLLRENCDVFIRGRAGFVDAADFLERRFFASEGGSDADVS